MQKEITLDTFIEIAKAGIKEQYVLTDHYLVVPADGEIVKFLKENNYKITGEYSAFHFKNELLTIWINR